MQEQLITFETAVLAKEKGFNESCNSRYVDYGDGPILVTEGFKPWYRDLLAPPQSLLQKWLREIHGIDVLIDSIGVKSGHFFVIREVETGGKVLESMLYGSYEHVLELGLKEALRLIKKKND